VSDWLLNEPVVRALHARLAGPELEQALADLRDAGDVAGESELLVAPAAVLDYPATPGELVAFPALTMLDRPSEVRDDAGHSATGRHVVYVLIHLVSSDQRQLAWGLRRYAQAVVRVMLRDRMLEGAAWGTGFHGQVPGDTLEAEEDPQTWHARTAVGIWADREEVD